MVSVGGHYDQHLCSQHHLPTWVAQLYHQRSQSNFSVFRGDSRLHIWPKAVFLLFLLFMFLASG